MKPLSFIVHLTRNDLLQLHSYANCRLLGALRRDLGGLAPAGALMLRLFGSGSMKSKLPAPDRHLRASAPSDSVLLSVYVLPDESSSSSSYATRKHVLLLQQICLDGPVSSLAFLAVSALRSLL